MKPVKIPTMTGPLEDVPEGTTEWHFRLAARVAIRAQARNGKSETRELAEVVDLVVKSRTWEVFGEAFPNDVPPRSGAEYFERVSGISWEAIRRKIEAFDLLRSEWVAAIEGRAAAELVKPGGSNNPHGRKGKPQGEGINPDVVRIDKKETVKSGGNGASYLLRRLAKTHPETLDRYEAGEFPSVRQAAIAAGIIRVPTQLEVAIKAVDKLDDEDRAKLITHLTT